MAEERILIVDDDEDILLIVQTILANAGYSVTLARNGREGVDLALELKPDLILLDVMMPELSGWEVCTTLKNAPETRQTPIVMMTVKSEIRDLITGMQVGADDYITKPFTRRKLLSTVRQQIEQRGESSSPFLTGENEQVRFKSLLFDSVTDLPTVPVIIDALRDRLLDSRDLAVLYIDVEQYSHIEDTYGWEVFDGLLRHTAKALRRMLGTVFAAEDFVAVNRTGGSDFYVFTSLEGGDEAGARLQRKARQVEESLRGTLDEAFGGRIHKRIAVFVGHAIIRSNPQMRVERLVYRALREAISIATTKERERQAVLADAFREIVRKKRIRTVYQPIFDLNTMELFGHEALTRGPLDSAFESPDLLFQFAGEREATWELEQLCLDSSASHYASTPGSLLFLNVEADSIASLSTRGVQALAPLLGLRYPVVLEVTERSAIRDLPVFRDSLAMLREHGFRIAIDDAGSGYASLQSIAELRPNFLKVASTLVTGLHEDTIKRDVVEMLVNLSRRIDALCVAEGIETPEDLEECRRLGIPYGQGFYIGVPEEKPALRPAREFVPTRRAES
ncbi:MAG TPA: EAL domain-containing protein [Thermoanaerobaculia bacterium]|nr:EAL domain-containing protein [Thermoanaerobaculia bacterium]